MSSNAEFNLKRLAKTDLPMEFVRAHAGEWDHQAWFEFCSSHEEKGDTPIDLEEKGYTPIDLDQVGLLLEQKKVEYWAERNSK